MEALLPADIRVVHVRVGPDVFCFCAVACHGERSLVHRSPSRAVVTGYPGGAVH
ncbi:unnamed protein product [Symbiodinium microadriaticum]|nr:unnamed protein product [Symbiodinium microadriaticum]